MRASLRRCTELFSSAEHGDYQSKSSITVDNPSSTNSSLSPPSEGEILFCFRISQSKQKELVKKSDNSDLATLNACIEKVSEIVDGVNQRLKKADTFKRLVDLKNKIVDLESVLAPHREYVKDGGIDICLMDEGKEGPELKEKYSWCLLFTDLLCFASYADSHNQSLQIKQKISLECVWIIDKIREGKSFEMKTPDSRFVPLNLNAEEQQQWNEVLSLTTENHLRYEQSKRNSSISADSNDFSKRRFKFKFCRGSHINAVYDGDWFTAVMQVQFHSPLVSICTEDFFQGDGCYVSKDGNVFNGQWKEGKLHGEGKANFISSELYSGQFKDSLPRMNPSTILLI